MTAATIERLAGQWWCLVIEGTIAATLVLLLVAASWRVMRRHASAHLGHALFLLPLVPLLLPLGRIVPLPQRAAVGIQSVSRWLPHPVPPSAPVAAIPAPPSDPVAIATLPAAPDPAPPAHRAASMLRGWSWQALAFLGWCAAFALLTLRFMWVQLDTRRALRAAETCVDPHLLALVARLARDAGVRHPIGVYQHAGIASPLVGEAVRPRLLLPTGLSTQLDERGLRFVLLHEIAHLRRGDPLLALGERLVSLAWFFHPVVWICRSLAAQLREQACDETAMSFLPDTSRRSCAAALLSVAERSSRTSTARLAVHAVRSERASLENRIMKLLDSSRPHRAGLGRWTLPITLLGVVMPLASCWLAMAAVAAPPAQPPAVTPTDDANGAATRALDHLIRTQADDGGWFAGVDATVAESGEFNRIGVTGFAMLALLEGESRVPAPQKAAAITRGLAFLDAQQDADTGLFGEPRGFLFVTGHAVATDAYLRAGRSRPDEQWRPVARRAIDFLLRARNPYRGWRYECPPTGDNDSFVTALVLNTLATARDAGFDVDRSAIDGGIGWLEDMTDPATGRTGYVTRGSPISRLQDKAEAFPPEQSKMVTALAISARLRWKDYPFASQTLERGAYLVAARPPRWDTDRGSIDYYHWLFGTDALRAADRDAFNLWRLALQDALLPHQNDDGSWPAIDAWSSAGSTVHATAINALALLRAEP